MIQKWPLMHASRRVTEKPLKETQAEVLVTKEGDNTQGSDLGINCARGCFRRCCHNSTMVASSAIFFSKVRVHNSHLGKNRKAVL